MIEVVTGVEELGYVEIKLLGELPADTKIVTKGAFYLFSSMPSIERMMCKYYIGVKNMPVLKITYRKIS